MVARRSLRQLVPRQAQALIRTAMGSARVVIVNGPRQAGKTTTVGQVHREVGGSLISFDDDALLGAARRDPVGFVSAYTRPLFVDEVQRGGEAFVRAILPSWSRNLTAKEKRRPKVHFVDTGLAAALLGLDAAALATPTATMGGNLLETLVVNELVKQQAASTIEVSLHHFRDRDGAKVDVVLETPDGRVAAIEVKAAMTVRDDDFRWLRWLESKLGRAFAGGVVLHTGSEVVPFGPRLRAVPVAALWTAPGAVGSPGARKLRKTRPA